MRVERVYDWSREEGVKELDPTPLDPKLELRDSLRLGHISDTHLGKKPVGPRERELRRWLETFIGLGVDAIVHTGDLLEIPDDEETIEYAFSLFDDLSVPLYGVPGNHDVQQPATPGEVTRRWGPFPRSVTLRGLRLWLLDSMAWPPTDARSERERQSAQDSGFYSRGALGPSQLDELKQLMEEAGAAKGPEIAVVHHHLRQPVPPKPWFEQNSDLMAPLNDGDDLVELLRERGVQLILHGHRHQYVIPYAPFDDLLMINAGSSTPGASPRRARVIDVPLMGDHLRIWELIRF